MYILSFKKVSSWILNNGVSVFTAIGGIHDNCPGGISNIQWIYPICCDHQSTGKISCVLNLNIITNFSILIVMVQQLGKDRLIFHQIRFVQYFCSQSNDRNIIPVLTRLLNQKHLMFDIFSLFLIELSPVFKNKYLKIIRLTFEFTLRVD